MLFLPHGARDEEPGQEGRAESGQPEPEQEVQAEVQHQGQKH